jgi:hypothetical protein
VIVFLGDAKPGLQALEVVVAVGESRGVDRSVVGQAEAAGRGLRRCSEAGHGVATVDSVGGAAEHS